MIIVQSSPNIALIKYWGKKAHANDFERNQGVNPSLSMTLANAQTLVKAKLSKDLQNHFFINDLPANEKDILKLNQHIERVSEHFGVTPPALQIWSHNNFPTGTGIASSASAFSALTIAISGLILGEKKLAEYFASKREDLAHLARRGSGSAGRSLDGPFVYWDDTSIKTINSDWKLLDTILIFSKKEKKVSSSDGHLHALSSPLFANRLLKLPGRTEQVRRAILNKSLHELGPLIEEEADEMHEVMRSGSPSIEYQTAESKRFLSYLKETKNRNFYYTLDAGPNVHLISETSCVEELKIILKNLDLSVEIWEDKQGFGPTWEFRND